MPDTELSPYRRNMRAVFYTPYENPYLIAETEI